MEYSWNIHRISRYYKTNYLINKKNMSPPRSGGQNQGF